MIMTNGAKLQNIFKVITSGWSVLLIITSVVVFSVNALLERKELRVTQLSNTAEILTAKTDINELQNDMSDVLIIVSALGRLRCQQDNVTAIASGLPCDRLTNTLPNPRRR
jgi:hypothetical protein